MEKIIGKLNDRTAKIAVLGLGYVGLPLSVLFAEAGFQVFGLDSDEAKVSKINSGISYIQDIEGAQLADLTKSGRLLATSDLSILKDIDAVSICVPTPLRKTGDPDLSFIIRAVEQVKKYLHQGMAIVLESTTYPGTTKELVSNILADHSGLKVGEDFYVAFSPERIDPGRKDWTTENMVKIVGGVTESCTKVCSHLYRQAIPQIMEVSSSETAEMVKLLENTFRMVNIGLINELALICDRLGVDIWEVIDAADTKPFGFMKFYPGPGLGGHCIPIDPLYLSWKMKSLKYTARLIELAAQVNTEMPRYVVNRVVDILNKASKPINGSTILILGVTYKPDVNDIRESPALDIINLLYEKNANVLYHDPYVPALHEEPLHLNCVDDLMQAVEESDLVVIVTNHSVYDYQGIIKRAKEIFDTRNVLNRRKNRGMSNVTTL